MTIEFSFIGWDNSVEPNGKKHDKVWTAFEIDGTYYAGWSARGKSLSFKNYGRGFFASSDQAKVMNKKQKSYKEVDAFLLFSVFPNFEEEVEQRLTYCALADKIK